MTRAQAAAAGIMAAATQTPRPEPQPPAQGSHEGIAATYSNETLDAIIADLGERNLSDYRDHETRWSAQRLRACRAERRLRKERLA